MPIIGRMILCWSGLGDGEPTIPPRRLDRRFALQREPGRCCSVPVPPRRHARLSSRAAGMVGFDRCGGLVQVPCAHALPRSSRVLGEEGGRNVVSLEPSPP